MCNFNDPKGLMIAIACGGDGRDCGGGSFNPGPMEPTGFGDDPGPDLGTTTVAGDGIGRGAPDRNKPFGYNGAYEALAKLDCYSYFGFSSAAAAQAAFASIDFQTQAKGMPTVQSVPGGLQAVQGTKPPAETTGPNTVTINSDYNNWLDFSKVSALNVSTNTVVSWNYLAVENQVLGSNMTTPQFANLLLLHEFSHTKIGGNKPGESDNAAFNLPIFNNCIK
jgi:hypothetical protein